MSCINLNYCVLFCIVLIIFIVYLDSVKVKAHIIKYTNRYNFNNVNHMHTLSSILLDKKYLKSDIKTIPNILFQTHYDKTIIPEYIFEGVKLYASDYEYNLLDDYDALIFLNTYFIKDVAIRYKELKYGAHKADLLRYCLLFIYGGVYLDIKTILIKPLNEIFKNKTYFYTAFAKFVNSKNIESYIYQGILASSPSNVLFLKLIYFMTYVPINYINYPFRKNYSMIIQHLYYEIKKDIIDNKIVSGLNNGNVNNYYLLEESCSQKTNETCTILDRYGYCCNIYDGDNKIFIGRDPTFPWKKTN